MAGCLKYLSYVFLIFTTVQSIGNTQEILFDHDIVINDWIVYRETSQDIPETKYKWPVINNEGQINVYKYFWGSTGYISVARPYYAIQNTKSNAIESMVYRFDEKVEWDTRYVKRNTTVLNVKCKKYKAIQPPIPNNFTLGQYENVRYSVIDCFLKNISSVFLKGLRNLRWLDLSNNNITTIEQHTFDDLAELEELVLSGNPISSLSRGLFCTMPLLQVLRMSNLGLTSFPSELFHPDRKPSKNRTACLGNLETLDFSFNRLEAIEGGAFSEMKMLKNLTLRNCSIHTLEVNAFMGLTHLEYMDIQHNWIKHLPEDIFANHVPALRALGLSYNSLTYFSFDLLSECKRLEYINIMMNRIKYINGTLQSNPVKRVSLYGNNIQFFPTYLFHSKDVINLDISNNLVSTINPDDFLMPRLKVLDVTNNDLTILNNNVFLNVSKLEILFLLNNSISELGSNSFAGLSQLKKLYLNNNKITRLPSGIFRELDNLQLLCLDNNRIISLDGACFVGLVRLKILSLRFNKIERIDIDTFNSTKMLQEVQLNFNRIDAIPYGIFQGCRERIITLSLRGNNLTALPSDWFTGFARLRDLDLSQNKLRNLSKSIFDNCFDLQTVNLAYNRITKFNASLGSLRNLRNLDISNNRLVDAWNIFENMYFMEFLNSLNLSWNNMTSLGPIQRKWSSHSSGPARSFLRYVNISHNALTTIPQDQFYLSTHIRVIDLSYNKLKTLFKLIRINPATFIATLIVGANPYVCDCNLRWVENITNNVIVNWIHNISNTFCSVPVLDGEMIRMSHEIPQRHLLCPVVMNCPENCDCFADQVKEPHTWLHVKCRNKGLTDIPINVPAAAHVLDVSNNIINKLDSTTFQNVSSLNLQILDLSNNGITALIGNAIFSKFRKLSSLKLNNNKISQLSGEPFKNLNFLNELLIANNSITTIKSDVFSNLTILRILDIEGNKLRHIDLPVFEKLTILMVMGSPNVNLRMRDSDLAVLRKFEWSILLSNNPWDCCRSLPLKIWLNNHQTIIPNLMDIYCMNDNITESTPLFKIDDFNLTCIPMSPVPFVHSNYFSAIIVVLAAVSLLLLCFLIVKRFTSHIKLKLYVWFGWRFDRIDNSDKYYDGFLSYSGLNGEWVRDELLEKLEEAGYKICLHERDFRVGEPIIDNINNAIDNSKRTIIVLSNKFLEGAYTMYEFVKSHDDWVRGERDPVILILYDPIHMLDTVKLEKHPTLNAHISTRTYLDRSNRYFWENLILAMPRQRMRRQANSEIILEDYIS